MKTLIKTFVIIFVLTSCDTAYLDLVSDKNKVSPQTLEDFQSLLDNSSTMNDLSSHRLAFIAVDEYQVSDNRWGTINSLIEKGAYIWESYISEDNPDWNYSYKKILYSNIVLEGLEKLSMSDKELSSWSYTKGRALFYRAFAFYDLAQLFCKTYDKSFSKDDLGLPLKLTSEIELIPPRSSLEDTYMQIIHDLEFSLELLPNEDLIKERPIKQAARALLARVYLSMQDYNKALYFAEETLKNSAGTIDYKTIDINARYPFPVRGIGNIDVIFYNKTGSPTILNTTSFDASDKFLSYYEEGDLRKTAYFFNNTDGRKLFKGAYTAANQCFTGLTIGETILIAAESSMRILSKDKALYYLNSIRKNRFTNYIELEYSDFSSDVDFLKSILDERRRELYRRGLHWGDLKRLNHDGIIKDTLTREIEGVTYHLFPNDSKYVWKIPSKVIELSGIQQN